MASPIRNTARFAVGERLVYRDRGSMTSRLCMVVTPAGRPPDPASALVSFEPVPLIADSPSFLYRAAEAGFRLRVPIDALHRPSPDTERLAVLEAIWHNRVVDPARGEPPLPSWELMPMDMEMRVLDAVLEDAHPYISRRNYPHGLRKLAEPPWAHASSNGPVVDAVSYHACAEARRRLGLPPLR
jgi:hypothetical protein